MLVLFFNLLLLKILFFLDNSCHLDRIKLFSAEIRRYDNEYDLLELIGSHLFV